MQREKFSSRLGFILISAGCAIGLGNVWRFPYIVGKYGGAAFVLIYLAFLLILDRVIPHLHIGSEECEGPKCSLNKSTMLTLAVTIHNIPEGISSGAIFAGLLMDNANVTLAGAFALSIGIALQNFPEGFIVSLPIRSEGKDENEGRPLAWRKVLLQILPSRYAVPENPDGSF